MLIALLFSDHVLDIFLRGVFETSAKSCIPETDWISYGAFSSPFMDCFALIFFFSTKILMRNSNQFRKRHFSNMWWVLTIITPNSCCLLLWVTFFKKPSLLFQLIKLDLDSFIQIRMYVYCIMEINTSP